jgi:hypothetical protein
MNHSLFATRAFDRGTFPSDNLFAATLIPSKGKRHVPSILHWLTLSKNISHLIICNKLFSGLNGKKPCKTSEDSLVAYRLSMRTAEREIATVPSTPIID